MSLNTQTPKNQRIALTLSVTKQLTDIGCHSIFNRHCVLLNIPKEVSAIYGGITLTIGSSS
jgi:hypothetical protein